MPFLKAPIAVCQRPKNSALAWILEKQPKIQTSRRGEDMNQVLTACITILLATVTQAHEGAEGVIKERMDQFKKNKEAMKAIKTHLGSDASVVAKEASMIQDWANQMADFFPEGSTQSPSEALPAIWENFEGFKARAAANAETAGDLANLARSGADASALINGFKALGKTCKDCHNDYKE
jgi:cytochrome c556